MALSALSLTFIALALLLTYLLFPRKTPGPLPPGPPRLPLIGNVLDFPQEYHWLKFEQWRKQYGDLVSLELMGQTILVISSTRVMCDIFEKKQAAARPRQVMCSELCGMKDGAPFTNDMELHQAYRRQFTKALNARGSQDWWPVQTAEARKLVARLLDVPLREKEDLQEQIRVTVLAIIALVSHGYTIESRQDRFAWLANKTMENFLKAAAPGAYLVDVIPALRFVPSWLPGAQFKRDAALWAREFQQLRNEPFLWVKDRMASGSFRRSFTSTLIDDGAKGKGGGKGGREDDEQIKSSATAIYAAGSDTSAASAHSFFLAMLLYPAVQARAQAEIDRVVGRDRLPTLEDKAQMPYCTALIKEVLRWRPVGPLGVPRALFEDVMYEGYYLPKGSTILANVWSMLRDPVVYPEPDKFKPERFLSPDGTTLQNPPGARDFSAIGFGVGRRICPGILLAEASLFIIAVTTLWAFKIEPAIGADGKPIEVKEEYPHALIQWPAHFLCDLKPRFPGVPDLVHQAVAEDAQAASGGAA